MRGTIFDSFHAYSYRQRIYLVHKYSKITIFIEITARNFHSDGPSPLKIGESLGHTVAHV